MFRGSEVRVKWKIGGNSEFWTVDNFLVPFSRIKYLFVPDWFLVGRKICQPFDEVADSYRTDEWWVGPLWWLQVDIVCCWSHLGCGPWGSSQIENAGAGCIFCVSCPFVRTGGLLLFFSNDWPPTCETFILWRKLCVSLKKGDKKHHFWAKKIPLKLTPEFVATQNGVRITHNMVPLPSKSEAESACFYNNKKNTISPAENVVLSRGSGPTSPIRPWGPTWTWMSCPASRLFIHDCVTWNTEYLLDKSKLTWLEHHSFKAFGSDLSSSYAILHCENCAAVRCESRHMRLALPPKLHHYCCFCLSNNNSFKQCCSWS